MQQTRVLLLALRCVASDIVLQLNLIGCLQIVDTCYTAVLLCKLCLHMLVQIAAGVTDACHDALVYAVSSRDKTCCLHYAGACLTGYNVYSICLSLLTAFVALYSQGALSCSAPCLDRSWRS